jgi:aspartate 1-decarboxylase
VVCVNGAAAHRIKPQDVVIICSYAQVDDADCRGWKGTRVFVDAANRIREIG